MSGTRGAADRRMFAKGRCPQPRAKGALAPPRVPLAPLEGIGTLRTDEGAFASTPFVRSALLLLRRNPISGVTTLPTFDETVDSMRYASHLIYMLKKDHQVLQVMGLYDDEKKLVRTLDGKWVPLPPIGIYSAVYKEETNARAIFNLAKLNEVGAGSDLKVRILGGHRFVARLRLHDPRQGEWVIVHADVKNAYYGIPTGKELSAACCVRIGKKILKAKVLCMGWTHSCAICQALVWVTMFRKGKGKADLGVPRWVDESELVPDIVELEGGGWVIVVIDSIFMMLPKEKAQLWRDRLEENFAHVRWKLKYLQQEQVTAAVTFGGVVIYTEPGELKWGLEDSTVEGWKAVASAELLPTPRVFFRLVSFLRFVGPVLCWPQNKLGRLTKAQSDLGQVEDWDEQQVPEEAMQEACRLILGVDASAISDRSTHFRKRGRGEVEFFAVDATPKRWAVYRMKGAEYMPSGDDVRTGDFEQTMEIDNAESFAFYTAMGWSRELSASVTVVANDNQVVGYSYNRGYARKRKDGKSVDVLDTHIKEQRFTETESRLVIGDVPGSLNVSDIGTRPEKRYTEENREVRLKATWEILQETWAKFKENASTYVLRHQLKAVEKWVVKADPKHDNGVEMGDVEEVDFQEPPEDETLDEVKQTKK